jgi:CRISPR/Cas system-associated exonuclease Cas4 (RecB family)
MALSVIKLESTLDAAGENFNWDTRNSWTIVCPNPNVADAFRTKVAHLDGVTTTTIAKFLSDIYKEKFPEKSVSRKADLVPVLATLWKIKMGDADSSIFHQAFELFTDLRSFTLDKALMNEILDHYPDIIKEAVTTFWLIIENQGIIDEHQAYNDLNLSLLDPDSNNSFDDGLIFTGFSHLSANQIEVLKTLGKFTDIYIPIPKKVIEESLSTDWVDWILSQADEVIEEEAERNVEEFNVSFFSKGRGNYTLATAIEESVGDVILPKKRIDFKSALEIPSRDFFFKSSVDFFSGVSREVKLLLSKNIQASEREFVPIEEVKDALREMVSKVVPSKQEDFVRLKFLSLLFKSVEFYEGLSEVNEKVSEFDLSVLLDITKLNQPRNFNLPLKKNFSFNLLCLADLYQVDHTLKNYLFVTSDHDLSIGGVPDYPKEVQELLIALGPMRRQALDLSFFVNHISDLLKTGNLEILMEEGLEVHDQVWTTLLSESVYTRIHYTAKTNEHREYQVEDKDLIASHNVKKLSASRMQTFLECPRKYYYSYVDKLDLEPQKVETIDPRHLGEAQHAVVQRYLENHFEIKSEVIHQLVDEELINYLPETILNTPRLYQEAYAETFFYSSNTIEQLIKIKEVDKDALFTFEVPVEVDVAQGRADVVIESKKLGKMIFDLKRSGGSIPDKYKFQGMKSIQLWFYLNFLAKEEELTAFGYINLSDAAGSLIFTKDKDVEQALKSVGFLKLKKIESLKNEFDTYKVQFNELFQSIYTDINEGNSMPIKPLDASVCKFCSGRLVCDRGVIG